MIDPNIYSEVYEILSYMDKKTVMKIPVEILEIIKNKRNLEYVSRINPQDIFNPNNVNEKTLEFLACLDVNYWMDINKKNNLELKYRKKIQSEELDKKKNYYNYELFNKKFESNLQNRNSEQSQDNSLVKYKDSLFTKIYNKFKKFCKIF